MLLDEESSGTPAMLGPEERLWSGLVGFERVVVIKQLVGLVKIVFPPSFVDLKIKDVDVAWWLRVPMKSLAICLPTLSLQLLKPNPHIFRWAILVFCLVS